MMSEEKAMPDAGEAIESDTGEDANAKPASWGKAPPCRLYVILAREAPVAVVFRRGPSKWVQVIKWDTATDTFTPGQWFHGRIYEKRCDMSPDGELLIYFAMNLSKRNQESDYTYAWTAISKLPYLTALALWPKGDCWAGGGLFLTGRDVWLNHQESADKSHPHHRPQGLRVTTDGGGYGEDAPILLRRLERDGWRHTQPLNSKYTRTHEGFVTHAPSIHKKQNPHGWQKLTMTGTLSVFTYRDEYTVRYAEGKDQRLEGAGWADWDQRGRLVYARDGKLFTSAIGEGGLEQEKELADFNAAKPEALEAPEWAKRW